MTKIIVAALYHFTKFSDHKKLKKPLSEICNNEGIKGSLPVSYTHLRAHETKANLVCRLLLEKKKTTNAKYKTFS